MNHTYYFMAGLPRAGSTLLKSIIDQNPDIYAGPLSPVIELIYYTQYYFHDSEAYLADPKPKSAFNVVKSIPNNYNCDIKKPIIIEHNRAWVNNIERIKKYMNIASPKIICTVRDVLEVLTSFITMIHRNSDEISYIDIQLNRDNIPITDDNRCDFLMSEENGIVGQALFAQEQAFMRGETEHLLMVEYNDIVDNTEETMRRIYKFLELDYYPHYFNNIQNNHREIDKQWGMKDMHEVRSTIKNISKRPEEVLSDYVLNKYSNLEYWKDSSKYNIN